MSKVLLLFLFCLSIFAQNDSDQIFEQVFGKKQSLKNIDLQVLLNNSQIGELNLTIKGDILKDIDRDNLVLLLENFIEQEELLRIKNEFDQRILSKDFHKLPIKIEFDSKNLIVFFRIPAEFKKLNIFDAREELPDWVVNPIPPNPYSFILNYDVEQVYEDEVITERYIKSRYEFASNIKGFVLENFVQYNELEKHKWLREDTRIIKDDTKRLLRYTIGDTSPNVTSYLSSRDLGGFSISRNFQLNPYRSIGTKTQEEFLLKKRSLVRFYVNSRLIKSQYLDSGKHSIKDLPLNDGVNDVLIEITDDFGKKEYVQIKRGASSAILAKGLVDFDFTIGKESREENGAKKYNSKNGTTYSSFLRYGHLRNLTVGGFLQGDSLQSLQGAESAFSTIWGNFTFELARSKIEGDSSGHASRVGYEWRTFGTKFLEANSFRFNFENRGRRFAELGNTNPNNTFSSLGTFSYSTPLAYGLATSLGVSYNLARDEEDDNGYGFNTSLSWRINNEWQLSSFYSRSKGSTGNFTDVVYFFFNWVLPERGQFLNSFYDSINRTKRLSYRYQSQKKIRTIRPRITIEENETTQTVQGQFDYLHPQFDLKSNFDYKDVNNISTIKNSRIKFQSSIIGTGGRLAVSRPVTGSFAFVETNRFLKGQKLSIKSISEYNDGESSFWGPASVSNLTPYQYYRLNLDTSELEPGYSVGTESYILYPTLRSGHLIKAGRPGNTLVFGKLLSSQGTPISLKTGYIARKGLGTKVNFFTNRRGKFIAESLRPGEYVLILNKSGKSYDFSIKDDQIGMFDLGEIIIQ